MKKYALITGASGGIGMDISRILSQMNYNLVLVARSTDKLEKLKAEMEANKAVDIVVVTKDLSIAGSAQELYETIKNKDLDIEILVNNAGFGDYGRISDVNTSKVYQMLQLNIISLTELTALYSREMVRKGIGRILNIASTASFQPLPYMAAYAASKFYVRTFSEAISSELKGTGVTVTTLCPGPTETDFFNKAEMQGSKLFERVVVAKSDEVALMGIKAMMKGKRTVVHGFMNRTMACMVSILPTSWVLAIGKKIMK